MKLALAASLVAAVAVSSIPQSKPNFSGTWVAISPANQAGIEETIKHTATEISFHHDSNGGGHGSVYRLDGTESRNEMGDAVSVAKAAWEGDKLLIHETTTYSDGRKMEMRQFLSLDSDGQLVREATATITGQPQVSLTVVARKK